MRQRINGFVSFMCKLDGKPIPEKTKRPKVTLETFPSLCVEENSEEILLSVLNGDYENLCDAFIWRETPHGHDYWSLRDEGIELMSDEDYVYVRQVYQRYFG